MAGARRFPQLVPIDETGAGVQISRRAVQWWAKEWDGPTFMAVGQNDPVIGPAVIDLMRSIIRGCPEPMMVDAGHFVQERGDQIAAAASVGGVGSLSGTSGDRRAGVERALGQQFVQPAV